mmetsp:Transcript_12308/g.18441  ORF Transcript_12308/g.18441 Transcript_12308/m.18441 type:complete len:200 (+) Transcript_12308:42-641(+)
MQIFYWFLVINFINGFLLNSNTKCFKANHKTPVLIKNISVEHDETKIRPYDEEMMQIALDYAKTAFDKNEVPIGAIIVKNGEVIAGSHNSVEMEYDSTAHAEILAMRRAAKHLKNWRLKGCTLYTTLEPCNMCLSAAYQFRIDHIIYGAPDLRLGGAGSWINMVNDQSKHPFHSLTVEGGVLEKESSELITSFFKKVQS